MTENQTADEATSDAPAADGARPDAAEDERVLAEWRLHLFSMNPGKSVAAAVVCAAALVLVHFAFASPWLTVLGGLILVGSLADWLFPITYRLTTRGAGYTNFVFRKRIAWDDVRSTYLADFGVKLSPFSRRTRLDAFRGVVVRFSGGREGVPGNREDVIRIVKERATKR
jgi:hypothetical protein